MKITAVVPWLIKVEGFWGEYLFVEVRTDEGISGWGEITTTTKIANRAVAGILRQLNDILVGDDPSRIEETWHKVFRAFTYMGTRGATSHVVSGIDIALWDIRGKVLDLPIYELLGGPVREDILLYTHPDQSEVQDQAKASSARSGTSSNRATPASSSTPSPTTRPRSATATAISTASSARRASGRRPSSRR